VDTLHASFPAFFRDAGFPPGGRGTPAKRGKRLLIFAGSSDKDIAGMLRLLAPAFDHVFVTRFGPHPRSVPAEDLAATLRQVSDVPFSVHATSPAAWHAARSLAGPDDLVCVTGSVFLAGELRPLILAGSSDKI
jgi:dihydrofolate synthase/folylpolyglutamate synthase